MDRGAEEATEFAVTKKIPGGREADRAFDNKQPKFS